MAYEQLRRSHKRKNNPTFGSLGYGGLSPDSDSVLGGQPQASLLSFMSQRPQPVRPHHDSTSPLPTRSYSDTHLPFVKKDDNDAEDFPYALLRSLEAMDSCIDKLVNLEYGFRYTGAGGTPAQATRGVRKAIQALVGSLASLQWFGTFPRPFNPIARITGDANDLCDALKNFEMQAVIYISIYYDSEFSRDIGRTCLFLKSIFSAPEPKLVDVTGKEGQQEYTLTAAGLKHMLNFSSLTASHVDSIEKGVIRYLDVGIPKIRDSQQQRQSRYYNMTAIAAFFCGVAASTLQSTTGSTATALDNAVNAFLFLSISFSIASAANSLLAMAWEQSFVRLPEECMNIVMRTWLTKGPFISLYFAGAFYSLGICLLSISSQQAIVTIVLVFIASSIHAGGLFYLYTAFISEQWKFRLDGGPTGRLYTYRSLTIALLEWIFGKRSSSANKHDEDQTGPKRFERKTYVYDTTGILYPQAVELDRVRRR